MVKRYFHKEKIQSQKIIYVKNNFWSKIMFGQKNIKKHINHAQYHDQLSMTILYNAHILHIQQHIVITKAHVKFQPDWLNIFREQVKK